MVEINISTVFLTSNLSWRYAELSYQPAATAAQNRIDKLCRLIAAISHHYTDNG